MAKAKRRTTTKPFAAMTGMPRVIRESTGRRRRLPLPAECAGIPDVYTMTVDGGCLAPLVPDGALVFAAPGIWPGIGDLALIYVRGAARGVLKRIVTIGPREWTLRRPHPGDEVVAVVQFDQLNPPKFYCIEGSKIEAVHKVLHVSAPTA